MSNLFPKIRLVIGTIEGCPWCDKFKRETFPMVKSLGIRYQIIKEQAHLDAYEADRYGLPLIVICDSKGFPLKTHGGFLMLSELMEMINDVYDEKFPGEDKNGTVTPN